MRKLYEIPEAEAIRTKLEMGLLSTTGSWGGWGVKPEDPEEFDDPIEEE